MTRDELRAWLDRKPPPLRPYADADDERPWHLWFGWLPSRMGGLPVAVKYLGERSARTRPDPVDAQQCCGCEQCQTPVTLKTVAKDGEP